MNPPKHILPSIVIAQFFCTSLWFAGNGVMVDLIINFGLKPNALGHLTSAVQFGFIAGTLLFAVFTLTDRYSPSKVFLVSALLGALCNAGVIWQGNTLISILGLRFLTGFFLAGIYPVGMKIAADYYDKGLGKSLSYLVGALVVGTALPHLLKGFTTIFSWQSVLLTTSTLAVLGGVLIVILVPNGPYRKASAHLNFTACFTIFKKPSFKAAALGYFGHMWELYVFWAFVPVMLQTHALTHGRMGLNIPILSFIIIALGGLACVLGGYVSQKIGVKKTAATILLLSGICCFASPLFFIVSSEVVFLGFLVFWGMVVVADSPLFSTLVAQNAPVEIKGTALTIVNCIGFAITILSLQLVTALQPVLQFNYLYLILTIGPVLGLLGLFRK
ncbi:MFS transporter [Flagellimonas eckloniae]|uniref:MFS transporter n=1 Tax=Flagellimonas eckloniae TaxID=346185 RepID=A0A0Q1C1N8_9FLAO|nr:MFS transporter [Allomuricauda eckloniae]KQC31136.1 MFS transporter [Allomuricauda eckloniae]